MLKLRFRCLAFFFLMGSGLGCGADPGFPGDGGFEPGPPDAATDPGMMQDGSLDEGVHEVWIPVGPLPCLTDPDCTQVMVAAHRGYHRTFPQNSLASIRGAADLGAEFIEIDLRHTKDDVLVLVHDDTVDGTTNGQGLVEEFTLAEIRELELTGADADNPETRKVPTFLEALVLARELGVMLYVDQKTWRSDLTLKEIQSGSYHDVALVRDSLDRVTKMVQQDPDLLVQPAIDFLLHFLTALEEIPNLHVVEIPGGGPDPEFTQAIINHGVKVQQDVLGPTDLLGALGDYSSWKTFIEAGVWLPQTDYPDILVPAVKEFNETGVFPDAGPGRINR